MDQVQSANLLVLLNDHRPYYSYGSDRRFRCACGVTVSNRVGFQTHLKGLLEWFIDEIVEKEQKRALLDASASVFERRNDMNEGRRNVSDSFFNGCVSSYIAIRSVAAGVDLDTDVDVDA